MSEGGLMVTSSYCRAWIPVGYSGVLLSVACGRRKGHDGPHEHVVETEQWSVTISGRVKE